MRRHVPCPRTAVPPHMTGNIDHPSWNHTPWISGFVDIRGHQYGACPQTTSFKWMWDETALYLAAQIETYGLFATQTEHDSEVFQDDCFELFLDPDCDGHNYLEWEINPLGTTLDLKMDRPYLFGGTRDDSWHLPRQQVALSVTGTVNSASDSATAWSFEASFPWSDIGAKPSPGDTWLCNLMRVAWPLKPADHVLIKDPDGHERYWVAQPTGLIDIHRPASWAVLAFVESSADQVQTWPGNGPVKSLVEISGIQSRTRASGPGFMKPISALGWTLHPDGRFGPSGKTA